MRKLLGVGARVLPRLMGAGVGFWILSTLPVSPVRAASLTVTKFTDSADGVCDSDCSLREAITAANATPGADSITLAAGTYALSLAGMHDDTNATGDLDIRAPLTIVGQGSAATTIDGQDVDRILDMLTLGQDVVLSGLTLTNGQSPDQGGGILCYDTRMTMTDIIVTENAAAGGGGGVYANTDCVIDMRDSAITGNTSIDAGAGIYLNNSEMEAERSSFGANIAGGYGGGIAAVNTSSVVLRASSVSSNQATGSGGGLFLNGSESSLVIENCLIANNSSGVEGGGIFLPGGTGATISGTTISGNSADLYGGGLNLRIPVTLSHATIANNTADADDDDNGGAGGILTYTGSAILTIHHTIIADNVDKFNAGYNDCYRYGGGGAVNSDGYNLVETVGNCTFASTGDLTGVDPQLGLLQDNGGRTWTHALAEASPALDAGDPAFAGPPYYDQRGSGFLRILGGRIDIGAFERGTSIQVFLPLTLKTG